MSATTHPLVDVAAPKCFGCQSPGQAVAGQLVPRAATQADVMRYVAPRQPAGWALAETRRGTVVFLCRACDAARRGPLKPFDEAAACPKCRHGTVGVAYQGPDRDGPFPREHLRRTCGRCGYGWAEAPLDAVAPAAEPKP